MFLLLWTVSVDYHLFFLWEKHKCRRHFFSFRLFESNMEEWFLEAERLKISSSCVLKKENLSSNFLITLTLFPVKYFSVSREINQFVNLVYVRKKHSFKCGSTFSNNFAYIRGLEYQKSHETACSHEIFNPLLQIQEGRIVLFTFGCVSELIWIFSSHPIISQQNVVFLCLH